MEQRPADEEGDTRDGERRALPCRLRPAVHPLAVTKHAARRWARANPRFSHMGRLAWVSRGTEYTDPIPPIHVPPMLRGGKALTHADAGDGAGLGGPVFDGEAPAGGEVGTRFG